MRVREIIGKNLYLLREALGLQQIDVANIIETSRGYVSQLETGIKKNVGGLLLIHIEINLNTTEYWLCEGKGWTYIPKKSLDMISFLMRQIFLKPQEIIFVICEQQPEGFIFKHPDYIISMTAYIPKPEEESDTKDDLKKQNELFYQIATEIIKQSKIKTRTINITFHESAIIETLSMETLLRNNLEEKTG